MNATTPIRNAHAARSVAAVIPPPRREPRDRGFGAGYGSSSGYFNRRPYSASSFTPRFRFG